MVIKGALWYQVRQSIAGKTRQLIVVQGESSTSWNPEYYICTFPAMVAAWRKVKGRCQEVQEDS